MRYTETHAKERSLDSESYNGNGNYFSLHSCNTCDVNSYRRVIRVLDLHIETSVELTLHTMALFRVG